MRVRVRGEGEGVVEGVGEDDGVGEGGGEEAGMARWCDADGVMA